MRSLQARRMVLLLGLLALMAVPMSGCVTPAVPDGVTVQVVTRYDPGHTREDPSLRLPDGTPARGLVLWIQVVQEGDVPEPWRATEGCESVTDAEPICDEAPLQDVYVGPALKNEERVFQLGDDGAARIVLPKNGTYTFALMGYYPAALHRQTADPDGCGRPGGRLHDGTTAGAVRENIEPWGALTFTAPTDGEVHTTLHWHGVCWDGAIA